MSKKRPRRAAVAGGGMRKRMGAGGGAPEEGGRALARLVVGTCTRVEKPYARARCACAFTMWVPHSTSGVFVICISYGRPI